MSTVSTALVLAGGKGERLRPLTDDRPKPMVPIDGRPLLEFHLYWLKQQGVSRAFILAGYLHDVIRDYFSVPRISGLDVELVIESQPLGRGGAFRNAFETLRISDDAVVATNGDVLTVQPLSPLIELHQEKQSLATVMLRPMDSPYGVVEVNDSRDIVSFEEKPVLPYWINAGVYILSSRVFSEFPAVGDHETETFPELVESRQIAGFESVEFCRSVETLKDLREVQEAIEGHEMFRPMIEKTAQP